MTPSPKELADGKKAYELMGKVQRSSSTFDMMCFCLLVGGVSARNAFEKGGWKVALGAGVFWLVITAVSIYQIQRLKKQAQEASTLLKTLKAKYGEDVYSEIRKRPHSLYYYAFLKRYPPFNRQSIKLP
jgi:hypothetical protein